MLGKKRKIMSLIGHMSVSAYEDEYNDEVSD